MKSISFNKIGAILKDQSKSSLIIAIVLHIIFFVGFSLLVREKRKVIILSGAPAFLSELNKKTLEFKALQNEVRFSNYKATPVRLDKEILGGKAVYLLPKDLQSVFQKLQLNPIKFIPTKKITKTLPKNIKDDKTKSVDKKTIPQNKQAKPPIKNIDKKTDNKIEKKEPSKIKPGTKEIAKPEPKFIEINSKIANASKTLESSPIPQEKSVEESNSIDTRSSIKRSRKSSKRGAKRPRNFSVIGHFDPSQNISRDNNSEEDLPDVIFAGDNNIEFVYDPSMGTQVQKSIQKNWSLPAGCEDSDPVVIEVEISKSGTAIAEFIQSSGIPIKDYKARQAALIVKDFKRLWGKTCRLTFK